MAVGALALTACGPSSSGKPVRRAKQRVFVLGFDGMDPTLARKWMDEGKLPNLKRLSEQKETDPACWHMYASEMMMDARRDTETLYWLRKAIRSTPPQSPLQARCFDLLARIRIDQRKFEEALELHHCAMYSS